ncbi:hypothetical protein WN51_05129 [Melipona quadrifasciata]|uniref:Uncharacterized protein n=1 Tax=Melipona quadrifasciata TaxID=166423 RepID=A0A0M8ZRE1_9HYME|nr:hypothetical protein WN51_05129 [Melipona quadrifasciata]
MAKTVRHQTKHSVFENETRVEWLAPETGTEGTEGWLRGETVRAAMADRDGDSWLRPGIKRRVTAGSRSNVDRIIVGSSRKTEKPSRLSTELPVKVVSPTE